ncbi:hypothetical protein BHE74_00009233 [Ensete ventricosum]|nr:hypothetical protein BHE74_00009233 [Ensete ventricosum]
MALRSLDNALRTTVEQRPKKVAKVAATPPAAKSSDVRTNNENTPPPAPPVDQSVEYVASEDLKPPADPDTRMEVCMYFSGFWTSVRFDSVISLLQLLLKASQDKRFLCDEAEKALEKMAVSVSPLPLLKELQSYGIEVLKGFGLATLLQVAAELLSDRLPEAREAARSIINSIYREFSNVSNIKDDDESAAAAESWQNFCASNLPPIAAQSVAKIVSL